eukprot:TRINITY_DN14473_c0_g1_i3.p1 TRINITY_DN14473_c0_g1~~TRINITY_DN14473_c0_g1_i3.p1  ORF type:complete len:177 (-),score=22.11 TRINITY_DN14473_c0_g1_i3:20-502(-)
MADFNARFGMGDSSDADDGQFPDFSEVDLTFEDKEEDLKPNRSSVVSSLREKAKTMRLTERRSVTARSVFSSFSGRFISEPTPARTKARDTPFNGIMPSSPCAETFPQKIQEPAKPRARAASVQHHRKTKRIGMEVSEGQASQIIAIPSSVGRINNLARS